VKELGPLLWHVSYMTVPMPRNEAAELEADLLSLENGGQLFLGYDPAHPFPSASSTLPLTGITVRSVQATRRGLSLTGLPVGFTLTKGDWISIAEGTNRHLLRVLENATGSQMFEVSPGVRPAIGAGQAVTIRYAPGLFMVDPGSVQRGDASGLHDVVSWTATQVIL
jgi:hypothetical protein